MKVQYRLLIGALAIVAGVLLFKTLIGSSVVTLFSPEGAIASSQSSLIKTIVLLMLVIVVPMFITLFIFSWKYRANNPKSGKYEPDGSKGFGPQIFLWIIPSALIAVLAVMNWQSAHALDPYKSIDPGTDATAAGAQPLTIQVVALTWKWLFIYPGQNIATVNYVEFPANIPVHFELTADAPMSSFWIPQLGSQIYAMDAMMTQLNLVASSTGEYTGKDTEINGPGYAGMTFTAQSVSPSDFNIWVAQVQEMHNDLDLAAYNNLAAPSTYNPPAFYSDVESGLFNNIMMGFMLPSSSSTGASTSATMPGMQM